MSVAIVAAGMVSATGLGLGETAASVRARLARVHESGWRDLHFEPFIVASVPEDGLPPLAEALAGGALQSREARMLRLAHAALGDLFAGLPPELPAAPLLLGLPEVHTTRPIDGRKFLQRLAAQAGPCFLTDGSIAAPRGRAAGLMALGQAVQRISSGQAGLVLVGGVESLLDPYVLGCLDREQRIRGEAVSDGFTPGEGAAFLLLSSEEAMQTHGLTPFARITGTGLGVEPGHLHSPEPYLGDGLAAAVTAAIEAAQLAAPLQTVFSSFNGERYWAREFGVARIRNAGAFADDARMEHPAECFGDLGAAHGTALAALAAHGLAHGYRRGPVLVYASSDHGDRAAAVFERSA